MKNPYHSASRGSSFSAAIVLAILASTPAAFAQPAQPPPLTRDTVVTKAPPPQPIDYDKLTQEATAFLSKYIQINTTNPPGDELPAAMLLKEKFLSDGIPATTWESAPGRGIIAARLHGIGKHHKAIILLCHMDVVPADAREWQLPPFSGEVKDGVIWGRGSIDDKGAGVVEMMAMLAIKRAGILLDRDVILVATGDEEEGGKAGAGWFVDHQPSVYADAGYVLNEGGGIMNLPGGKQLYDVSVTEKTPLWLRVTATGPAGHAAVPPAETAVTKLVRALARLDEYHAPIRIIGPVENYYHTMAEITHGPHQWLDLATALKEPAFAREFVSISRQNAAVRDTITPTVLSASAKTNVIAANAYCEIDCRLLPGTDPKKFLRTIEKVIDDKDIHLDVILNFPPVSSPQRSELMTAIEALARRDGKAQVVPTMTAGFTDSHYFRQKNLIAYGFMPISVTSDEARGVHGINERIGVKELGAGIKRMVELLELFGGR
ncbi:MAG TPA: M20/M25/M40 family metallo-hydrolase [Candidatus Binataceae bacterium]|nr:M20/M25/M40 family metallo-hydrolase [Candidatus Binataceae bacterium]